MQTQHKKRSPVSLGKAVFLLPAWLGMSVVVMYVFVLLLANDDMKSPPIALVEPQQEAYHLFTSVPEQGTVLGQRISSADLRVVKLSAFLAHYRSPMPAQTFITAADTYNLPWTLLPAIACKESGCGRAIPKDSFNAFGWAVYTGQNSGANFLSWDEGIDRVARGLREEYYNRGFDTVEKIETKYTPPSATTHHKWLEGVRYFMNSLETWES
ncbi:hypothetical protein CO180_03185 [candidate division WWE3 bacterium CG_4_9_14_3_um_filter_41_6]|uniref:Mannosyl-glycoprotein endo-beta-N-acetylglucosamidase-like domain-containing protein n=1 Tax=candidate division WWE3 bacterium CG_4_10_14_0_2_um_filter_41_14 TaxID=1975072 RepID=A0A2M7TL09_UNCKA|nr:MAG: hypothetical protein COY32_01255 [candidate division WWE3 bacterium CG_4_10_14_0_2_um_filter_41_14]PJA38587.1 MAG: hypothetical protein CO180_03185 [candidate division WWE3 bacterium CG_4_9_14_3_um_filter_41_6]